MQLISRPLEVVQELFKRSAGPGHGEPPGDFGVVQHFQLQVEDPEVYNKIPVLTHANVHYLPNNSLVRFSGMVQDMGDPQYYYGAVQLPDGSWSTTKYGDVHQPEALASTLNAKIWERRPLFCVPVPGRASWTQEQSTLPLADMQSPGATKRPRSESGNIAMAASASPASSECQDTDMQSDQVPHPVDHQQDQDTASLPAATKIAKTGSPGSNAAAAAATSQAAKQSSLTLPGDCIVYAYDTLDGLSLNDVIEVVGVVSHTPEAVAWQPHGNEPDEQEVVDPQALMSSLTLEEHQVVNPAARQVMRVHAITVRVNPSLVPPCCLPVLHKSPEEQARQGRQVVMQLLTSCLGGDRLAAEYLLLNSLARVNSRVTGQCVVGPLPINLTRCPSPPKPATTTTAAAGSGSSTTTSTTPAAADAQQQGVQLGLSLHSLWSSLLPLCSYLPLTIPACNQGTGWAPRRDPDTNRVSRSPLQLPRGCMLLVDEVALEEGQLTETGIKSLQAVQDILQDQALPYDFVFYSRPFPVDLPCVVLSEGRSLLHTALNTTLPLQPTQPFLSQQQVQEMVRGVDSASLAVARSYLQTAVQSDYTLGDDMMSQLQNDFVALRKADPTFSAEAFQLQLTMARLCAISWGQGELTGDRWKEVQQMEHTRRQRCAALEQARADKANNSKNEH